MAMAPHSLPSLRSSFLTHSTKPKLTTLITPSFNFLNKRRARRQGNCTRIAAELDQNTVQSVKWEEYFVGFLYKLQECVQFQCNSGFLVENTLSDCNKPSYWLYCICQLLWTVYIIIRSWSPVSGMAVTLDWYFEDNIRNAVPGTRAYGFELS